MTKGRKTVSVGKMLAHANWLLLDPRSTVAERRAWCTMVEVMLFESGNYRGFTYIMPYDEWKDHSKDEREFQEYRRHYYVHPVIWEDYDDSWQQKVQYFGEPDVGFKKELA